MKLTRKQRDALQESIWHWYENLSLALGDMPNHAVMNSQSCRLCDLYYENACIDCPVRIRTRKRYCDGTPFYSAWDAGWGADKYPIAIAVNQVETIIAEIHFLESLDTEV